LQFEESLIITCFKPSSLQTPRKSTNSEEIAVLSSQNLYLLFLYYNCSHSDMDGMGPILGSAECEPCVGKKRATRRPHQKSRTGCRQCRAGRVKVRQKQEGPENNTPSEQADMTTWVQFSVMKESQLVHTALDIRDHAVS
jgi:hypothetical protein